MSLNEKVLKFLPDNYEYNFEKVDQSAFRNDGIIAVFWIKNIDDETSAQVFFIMNYLHVLFIKETIVGMDSKAGRSAGPSFFQAKNYTKVSSSCGSKYLQVLDALQHNTRSEGTTDRNTSCPATLIVSVKKKSMVH